MGFEAKIREEYLGLKSNLLKRPVFRSLGNPICAPQESARSVFEVVASLI